MAFIVFEVCVLGSFVAWSDAKEPAIVDVDTSRVVADLDVYAIEKIVLSGRDEALIMCVKDKTSLSSGDQVNSVSSMGNVAGHGEESRAARFVGALVSCSDDLSSGQAVIANNHR